MILDDIFESALPSRPTLSEGVIDRLKNIYMSLVYDTPLGTPDSEFLAQWQRIIKDKLGQDIDWDTLANLQQHWREQGRRMTRRGDLGKWYREMGMREEVDTGEYDARKTVPSSKEEQEKVFARHRERVKNINQEKKQEKKKDVAEAIPPHIKPSDIPPAMRNRRLTMKDVEAERPQGAFRFRVGDKDFMDLAAAQEFATGTGQRVERIREAASQKKTSNARIERILKQLRAKHPQAQDDLEALIYDFRSSQSQDRRDISRLDMENDMEEADIERLEKILTNLKQQRELAEYRTKKKTEEPQDNFTIDDIKRLETIADLETLKAQAKQLIKGKPARRMKPEKIAYFYDRVDNLTSRLAVVKMMYDLLLAGEGHKVIGQRHSMDPNVYQRRFGETKDQKSPGKIDAKEDPCWSGYHMVGTKKKNGREVPNCVPGEKGSTNEDIAGYAVSIRRAGSNETPVKA